MRTNKTAARSQHQILRTFMSTNWVNKKLAGWGRYPVVEMLCARPQSPSELRQALADRGADSVLAFGLGRSYGDVGLLRHGKAILTERLDRMLAFDPESGWLRCEAGVGLAEIIKVFLPRGFFPPVVPGTQFVTVGGALANNIHGKNHHVDGCWGDHVRRVELLTASGEIVFCDKDHEPELFWATVGGLGLTGLVLSMEIRLTPVHSPHIDMETVRVNHLDEFFEVSAASADFTHTVSWIDCAKRGLKMGRGVFMRGRHAAADATLEKSPLTGVLDLVKSFADGRPFESNLLLNKLTIKAFNEAYFRIHPAGTHRSIADLHGFFFPLDAVDNWNYAYGSRGFLQYQIAVPHDPEHRVMREVLRRVSDTGMASFLAVIKEFGDQQHGGLSFPIPGVTLALDFPNYGPALFALLDTLDALVVEAGGRVYLGKDARLSRQHFRIMYPEWERWRAVRDRWDPNGVFKSELGKRLGLVD